MAGGARRERVFTSTGVAAEEAALLGEQSIVVDGQGQRRRADDHPPPRNGGRYRAARDEGSTDGTRDSSRFLLVAPLSVIRR